MKPCACGCRELISDTDKYGRNHYYKHGHNGRGQNHYNWKGGKQNHIGGYIRIRVDRHPRASSNDRFRMLEHIIVMEKHLGRYLEPHEIVHHKNGDKKDNRIENLELTTRSQHINIHRSELNLRHRKK